ncbi:alpha/beta hydrolase family protein [Ilumatobacter nonamiensis]|uniref:alpha/beta hydrolase family protein n=1 Tax=Ilumatobacter nonamiensis TaxID=467093 RepID=UPI000344D6EF|nr:alpha/beta fold hydrolase [Ilumatobacter nonamiensis]
MRRTLAVLVGSLLVAASCASDDAGTSDTSDSTAATTATETIETVDDEAESTTPATEPAEPSATEPSESVAQTDPPATDAPAETTTTAAELDELALIGPGEYDVGVSTITITDTERDRPLTVDVWYPLADGTTGEPHRYTFVTGDYYESPTAISADAASIAPDGPFPLVVYSHGSGGQRYIASNYTEAIASHGYVVVAPDHTGNTAVERISETSDDQALIALNRPADVRVVIDAMLDPENPETAGFVASTDPERVAVTGHSFGGFTAYAAASGYDNELGSVEADPLVDAIIPIAPAVGSDDPDQQLLSDERLEAITTPALVIAGTNDQTTPIEPNVRRAWDLTSSDPSYRLELVDAQHQTFTDLCDYIEFFPTLPEVNPLVLDTVITMGAEGCSPGDMPIDRAQEVTNTFAISFLDSIFEGTEMIDPDTTEIPDDVVYLVK